MQSIELVELSNNAGDLSIDETAILRFLALTQPDQLPDEFRPTTGEIRSTSSDTLQDGLAIVAEMLDALFIDRDEWRLASQSMV